MPIPDRPRQFLPFRGEAVLTWPEDAAIDLFHTQPTMGAVTFSDGTRFVEPLAAVLEEAAADRAATQPIAGGAFAVEDILTWDDEALDLVDARAWKLVTSLLNANARIEQAQAIMIPPQRELPLRPHVAGTASVVMLVTGSGLQLRHQALKMAPVPPPSNFGPGSMLAHPSTMRPCVTENRGEAPVWLLTWDFQPVAES